MMESVSLNAGIFLITWQDYIFTWLVRLLGLVIFPTPFNIHIITGNFWRYLQVGRARAARLCRPC